MRLFVAVNPTERFTHDLDTWLDRWRPRVPAAWTRRETWHLTLAFLGEWPAERAESLALALSDEAPRHPGFLLRPGELGAFPNLRTPRVLFLQMDGGEALAGLATAVRARVEATWPEGPQDRKVFRPHLTLARFKAPLEAEASAALAGIDPGTWPPQPVAEVRLVRSTLRPSGARYADVAVFPLGPPPVA